MINSVLDEFNLTASTEDVTSSNYITKVNDPVADKKQEEKNKKTQIIKKDSFGIEKVAIPNQNKPFTISIKDNKVYVYLFGMIFSCEEYVYLNSILNSANENTQVHVYIDSPGGEVTNAFYLAQALKNTKAKTIATACGKVMSAATMIFNACETKIINSFSLFMFHDFSTHMGGKGNIINQKLNMSIQALKLNENSLLSTKNVMLRKYLNKGELEKLDNSFDVYIPGVIIDRRLKMGVEYV